MLLKQLVEIDSQNPPGDEKEIAKFIFDYLSGLKIQAELIKWGNNRYNVVGEIGKGEGLMLNGHVDTVPIGDAENWKYDPFGEAVGDRFYGIGASDMKGGIAAILEAAKAARRKDFKRRLLLCFVGDEETSFGGSLYLLKERREIFRGICRGIIAEPTDMRVKIGQKGVLDLDITIGGRSAHGSRPERGDSAISKATEFIRAAERLPVKKDSLLGKGTVNVGVIAGGTKVNMVPDRCRLEIDRRLVRGETPEAVAAQYKALMKKMALKGRIDFRGRKPFVLKDRKFIRDLAEITKSSTKVGTGYSEAELYSTLAGINCAIFGPGTVACIHAPDEWISIKNYNKSVRIFEDIIRKYCA